jgi:DUF971 family protein
LPSNSENSMRYDTRTRCARGREHARKSTVSVAVAQNVRLMFIRTPRKCAVWLLLCNSHDEGIVHQTVLSQPGNITVDARLHMPAV